MDTIDELIDYCKSPEPTGALLLTVEWGGGKTYIINNDYKRKMANKAKVLRISLFGIPSADEIHRNIKLSYIETILLMKTLGMIGKAFSKN